MKIRNRNARARERQEGHPQLYRFVKGHTVKSRNPSFCKLGHTVVSHPKSSIGRKGGGTAGSAAQDSPEMLTQPPRGTKYPECNS